MLAAASLLALPSSKLSLAVPQGFGDPFKGAIWGLLFIWRKWKLQFRILGDYFKGTISRVLGIPLKGLYRAHAGRDSRLQYKYAE